MRVLIVRSVLSQVMMREQSANKEYGGKDSKEVGKNGQGVRQKNTDAENSSTTVSFVLIGQRRNHSAFMYTCRRNG